jgi:hypothetical protein
MSTNGARHATVPISDPARLPWAIIAATRHGADLHVVDGDRPAWQRRCAELRATGRYEHVCWVVITTFWPESDDPPAPNQPVLPTDEPALDWRTRVCAPSRPKFPDHVATVGHVTDPTRFPWTVVTNARVGDGAELHFLVGLGARDRWSAFHRELASCGSYDWAIWATMAFRDVDTSKLLDWREDWRPRSDVASGADGR